MFDINNKKITEGQYLKITGCKVKGDNGIYIVDHKYKDNGEYCLYKVLQNGELSKTKYNIYFLNEKNDLDKQVTIISKDELKQAAKDVKAFINGITASETVYTFTKAEKQEVKEGLYIHFIKHVTFTGHINSISGVTYEIKKVDNDGSISLYLIGKKGEKIAYNSNGYYQFTPIMLHFKAKTIQQLFNEGDIEILERHTSTKGETKTNPEYNTEETITAESDNNNTPETTQEVEQPITEPETNITETTKEYITNIKITPVYYPINERAAKSGRSMWSMSDYIDGSETASYKKYVDNCYDIVRQIAIKKPDKLDQALKLAERYSRKLAENKNNSFRIQLMCPSVMIAGPSNFPVRKKEKQNRADDKNMEEWNYIQSIPKKIEDLLYGRDIIKSSDENAIEQLQEKIETLTADLTQAKEMNRYYRKNKTIKGFPGLTEEQATKLQNDIDANWNFEHVPYASFDLTSIRNKIKAAEDRIAEIQRLKTTAEQKQENDYNSNVCKVVENTDIMRIQLLFNGKPEDSIRSILKSNGFRWSPREMAWQRQLTDNARYTTKKVLQQLEQLTA